MPWCDAVQGYAPNDYAPSRILGAGWVQSVLRSPRCRSFIPSSMQASGPGSAIKETHDEPNEVVRHGKGGAMK